MGVEQINAVSRPVLRYHGGKWRLAPWIISHFPAHRIYVEPFGGGGNVLMRKPRSWSEVYNDAWDLVVNVFRVLRDPELAAELKRRIELTPWSRSEFERTYQSGLADIGCSVERARLTIYRSFAGFGSASINGEYPTGFRANSNRSGSTPAHGWMKYPASIDSFVERLRGVIIECLPATEVMQQHDGPDVLHYVDPPYVHATRNMNRGNAAYCHEMSDEDHRELAAVLHRLDGMVVLSGYHCALYDELFQDWQLLEKKTYADGARERTECLWLNRAAARRMRQGSLFDAS